MYRKFSLLMSFVLVVALCGTVRSQGPIDVNNPSFELNDSGTPVLCHEGVGIGWRQLGTGYVGVDVNCGSEGPACTNCHDWIEYPNGNVNVFFQPTNSAHQITDFDIALDHKYTMTVDLLAFDNTIVLQLFAGDPCTPDEGHILLGQAVYVVNSYVNPNSGRNTWEFDKTVSAIVTDPNVVGKKLGIKIGGDYLIGGGDDISDYLWADNVRLEWDWDTSAYNPNPADGAENVSKTAILSWSPGLYASNHQVYLGTNETAVENADSTDLSGIYRGTYGPNSYDAPETFSLATTYYWRIDEVNSAYSGTQPPAGPWTGNIWSFTTTGRAINPYPANHAEDVSPEVTLSWTAGTDATAHAVYFGTSSAAVNNATSTDTTGIYKGTQAMPDVDYVPGFLTLGKTYFWRIDAISAVTIKGYVWSFTVAPFNPVDDYELYANHTVLKAAWNDYWYGPGHTNHGYVFVNTDANFTRDGNSMMFTYNNSKSHGGSGYVGSWATGLVSKIPVGNDWTAGGVEALVLYFYGKVGNSITQYDQMYVRLADGATPSHAGVVRLPDMNDVAEASWHEWNIDLADPAFSTVVKTNVTSIRVGFGGPDGGGGNKAGSTGTVYFDDIQLWPSRCRPELPNATDLDEDCITGTGDLAVMANDWLFSDGYTKISTKKPGTLYGNPTWVTAGYTGNALQFDGVDDYVNVPDPCLTGAAAMSITCWVKPTAANDWTAMVSSRESVGCGDDASELGLYGKAYGGPDGLGYDWSCGTEEWQFDAGLVDPAIGTWTFCAVAVDPTGASLYSRASGGSLNTGLRNAVAHSVQKNFARKFWIGMSKLNEGFFIGVIDDVRIYDYALTLAQITNMSAAVPSDPNPWPVYWYKFEEGSGTTAADSGYGANIYRAVDSPANLTDPEAQGSRKVNFMDFAIIADNWLEQIYWP